MIDIILFGDRHRDNTQAPTGSVFLIEFNHLKDEDTLKLLSLSIHHLLREYPNHLVARFSHTSIAILLPNHTEQLASGLAPRICATLHNYFTQSPDDTAFNIGIVCFTYMETVSEILSQAEEALHQARHIHQRCWFILEKGLHYPESHGWHNWSKHLALCIREQQIEFELTPFYGVKRQLIFNNLCAFTDGICGNTLGDEQLCLLAEKSSLELPFLRLKLSAAHNLLHTIEGSLSITTHAKVIASPFKLNQLLITLYQYPTNIRQRLIFEIRESEVTRLLDKIKLGCFALHALGCKLCINRAGRQVEGMQYLSELSVDYLKLDQHMLINIEGESRQLKALESIRLMLQGTSTQLLAQHIKSQAHWEQLQLVGIEGAPFNLNSALD
ncbi:EAL domain-containing protein [Dongshaea marina]|uniref:EAL domain-containing protein n=1 Tax=Dongshaea marina TaxID=2047966 RepID=UPI00131EF4A8|nr:EAL domain-containing protein [Dongshaea marina]